MLSEPWRIQLLGGLAANLHDIRIDRFRSRKAATLFAYLAFYNHVPTSREFLAEMLWPDQDIDTSRNRLRVTLASLRRQFEPPPVDFGSVLIANRSHISFREGQIITDVDQFRRDAANAERIEDERARTHATREALELYRGELLPGLYEDWIDEERRALEHLYHESLTKVTDLLCSHGETAEALPYALRLAGIDPLDEPSQCRLMSVYAALGQPGKATEAFDSMRTRLRDELGAEPSSAAKDLIAALCGGKQSQEVRLQYPVVKSVAAPAVDTLYSEQASFGRNLPTAASSFHGRKSELARLALLLAPQTPADTSLCKPTYGKLVTLTGVGGIGKSRLALQAAAQLESYFQERAWFVPLADVEDSRQLPQTIANALRLRLLPHRNVLEQLLDELIACCERGPSLVVLDNFEQLVGQDTEVIELILAHVPCLCVLVTSRRLLGINDEREFHVEPLEVPHASLEVELAAKSASVAMFVARAQRVRPDFQLTPRNTMAVARLCHKLDGIPLAIELAAARIRLLTPAQMIAEMDQRFDLLVNRRATKDSRHRSLRAAVESSVQVLPAPAREFLALLSVFRGSWNLEAAREVSGYADALDMLDDLVGYSLIQTRASEGEMRYSILETIREYAVGLLTAEQQALVDFRHAQHYTNCTERYERNALSSKRDQICAQYDLEKENIRSAWLWALRNDLPRALDIAANLRWVFYLQHRLREGEDIILQSLQAAGDNCGREKARALVSLGALRCYMDDFANAAEPIRNAIELLEPDQEREQRLATLYRGWVTTHEGDFDSALALLDEARCLFAINGETWLEAGCLNLMGFAACYAHRFEQARELFGASRELYLFVEDPAVAAHGPLGMGRAAWMESNLDESEIQYRAALTEFRDHGDRRGIAYALEGLARVASDRGSHIDAMRLTGASRRLRDQIALKRDPMDQAAHDTVVQTAIAALNEESRKAAWDMGYRMGERAADRDGINA